MRNLFFRILCLVLTLAMMTGLLAGCGGTEAPAETQPSSVTPTENPASPTQATEPVQTESPSEATEAPTEASEEIVGFQPYLETVYLADLPIFSGPSYDDGYAGIVEESGVYTIVEEAWDYEGNLWGRLKSGAGWINLTDSRIAAQAKVPVSAGYASQRLLSSGNYDQCICDESEYAVKIAFRFYEEVTDVCFSYLLFDGEAYVVADTAGAFPRLSPEKPMVMWLSFPGDMSCYGLYFTDSSGAPHRYIISISGRNGLVVLTEEAS